MKENAKLADRQVTKTKKDKNGDITALCNSGAVWSPKFKSMAILEIEENIHRYFVIVDTKEIDIHVVNDLLRGKYLRTDKDAKTKNNLDDLPDC